VLTLGMECTTPMLPWPANNLQRSKQPAKTWQQGSNTVELQTNICPTLWAAARHVLQPRPVDRDNACSTLWPALQQQVLKLHCNVCSTLRPASQQHVLQPVDRANVCSTLWPALE
jgi:hypothetical protein